MFVMQRHKKTFCNIDKCLSADFAKECGVTIYDWCWFKQVWLVKLGYPF